MAKQTGRQTDRHININRQTDKQTEVKTQPLGRGNKYF